MNLADLFDQVARAAAILDTDGDFIAQVTAARAKLAPDQIGAEGQLQEWQQVAIGVVVLLAVYLDIVRKKNSSTGSAPL